MGEKNKWFDPQKKEQPLLQPVISFKTLSRAGRCDCERLIEQVEKQGADPGGLFSRLADMPPADRLRLNSVVVVGLLAEGAEEIYSPAEVRALVSLTNRAVSNEAQQTAYALLNTYERYQLQQSMSEIFRDARAQKFEDTADGGTGDA